MTQRTLCRARGAPICNFSLISAGAHGLGISVFFCAGCEIEIGDGVAAWLKYGKTLRYTRSCWPESEVPTRWHPVVPASTAPVCCAIAA